MIALLELKDYLHQLLNCEKFNDYCPNGLQLEGQTSIERLATAVTASQAIIEAAAKNQADALLVHHGFFWKGEASEIVGMKYRRLKSLIDHKISLFAYHLPLDCHLEFGNNRSLAPHFGVESYQAQPLGATPDLLWSGKLPAPLDPKTFAKQITQRLNREPLLIAAHNKPIHKIAWCSGGAQDFIIQAAELGVDAYLSGEVSERTYHQALELGIHYYACGHHATEKYGIQALGEHLATQFQLEHFFIDCDNPV